MDQIAENLGSPAVVIAAVVPAILLMWFFHSRDIFREPARVLWITFALGVGCIALLLPAQLPIWWLSRLVEHPAAAAAFAAFVGAAVPEELCKFAVLYRYPARHREFNEPMDGIVYGAAASLGFAAFENLLYAASGGMTTATVRAFTAVPAHATFGAVMGYYMGQAFLATTSRRGMLVRALGYPILLHGLYDFPLMAAVRYNRDRFADEMPTVYAALFYATSLAVLVAGLIWTGRLVRRVRARQRLRAYEGSGASALLEKPRGATGGWTLLITGSVLAIAGALLIVLLAMSMLERTAGVHATAQALLVGTPVVVLGATMFGLGIKALNRLDTSPEDAPGPRP